MPACLNTVRLLRPALIAGISSLLLWSTLLTARALPQNSAASQSLDRLFDSEIQQAASVLHWRGEKPSDDTLYAAALTGLSWHSAWGKEEPFLLARPGIKPRSRGKKGKRQSTDEILEAYRNRDYQRVTSLSSSLSELDDAILDPDVKEAVGVSFLKQGQANRAVPILVSPFDPGRRDFGESLAINHKLLDLGFQAARQARLRKESVAIGLALILQPTSEDNRKPDWISISYLDEQGVDLTRISLGILQAPNRQPRLSAYAYSAVDLLLLRLTPRMLPYLMHLATSDDVYLHGRALEGLGVLAWRSQSGEASNWQREILPVSLQAYGLSVGQRTQIDRLIHEALNSGNYRLRTSGTLALAFAGGDEAKARLQKLLKDRAYTLSPAERGSQERIINFPVREAAVAGLRRYGIQAETGGGSFHGKDLDRAKRGGQDVTSERHGLLPRIVSGLTLSSYDPPLPIEKR